MADTVKELFNKKFTSSEVNSGATFNFTTDASTAFVIKDIEVNQNDEATQKLNATASVGLTSDFSATPSKFTDLGTIASASVKGATGSEIMDASSTFSIRVPAQKIEFSDIVHHQVSAEDMTPNNNCSVTEVEAITPSVAGAKETALTPTSNTQTSFGTNFTSASMGSNRSGQYRVFVTNPHTNVNLAIAVENDNNQTQKAHVSGYGNTTNYGIITNNYKNVEWDGRFLYSLNNTSRFSLYDTMGAASRAPTSNPHTFVNLRKADGSAVSLPTAGSTYPKLDISYFSDVDTRNALCYPSTGSGMYWFELPNYDGSDGLALSAVNGVDPATTKFFQIQNSSNVSNSSAGPSGNRRTVASIEGTYASSLARSKWYLGTSANSQTKRVLFFQNGDNTNDTNRLFWMIADTEYLSTTSTNDSAKVAYSQNFNELRTNFGWAVNATYWNEINSNLVYLQCSKWKTMVGSNAEWGVESHFWLDQDTLYFTNLAAAGTGEGPIIAWNMVTDEVSAPITWAQYKDTSNNALANPGGADTFIGHRSVKSTPSSSQIASRTYSKEPTLQVRATGIQESR